MAARYDSVRGYLVEVDFLIRGGDETGSKVKLGEPLHMAAAGPWLCIFLALARSLPTI